MSFFLIVEAGLVDAAAQVSSMLGIFKKYAVADPFIVEI
jgi:hypothetical protein